MLKKSILFIAVTYVIAACSSKEKQEDTSQVNIKGSWKLLSSVAIRKDTVIHNDIPGTSMIKIINDTHFAFMQHELATADTVKNKTRFFSGGGGSYTLKGDQYTEHLEYCSAPAYEGNDFTFTMAIAGDTLIQKGEEKLKDIGAGDENQLLIEKYIKIKN